MKAAQDVFCSLFFFFFFARYLYTLRLDEPEKAEKLRKSLPPTVKVVDVK